MCTDLVLPPLPPTKCKSKASIWFLENHSSALHSIVHALTTGILMYKWSKDCFQTFARPNVVYCIVTWSQSKNRIGWCHMFSLVIMYRHVKHYWMLWNVPDFSVTSLMCYPCPRAVFMLLSIPLISLQVPYMPHMCCLRAADMQSACWPLVHVEHLWSFGWVWVSYMPSTFLIQLS